MKKLLLIGLLTCACSFAQNISQFGGIYSAINYAYGSGNLGALAITTGNSSTGASTITLAYGTVTLSDGVTVLAPLAANAPIFVGNGANLETVTPTALGCNTPQIPNSCRFTANFTKIHGAGERISSGTFGLYEALNAAAIRGGSAIIDGDWVAAGGTQGMVDAAPSFANATIIDNRDGFTGGGGAGNPGGTNGQIQFNNSGVFGGISSTGTGNVVRATSPTLVTPALGTPSALVLTNATSLPGGQITGANSVAASTLPLATTGAFGVVKPDGTTVTISAGVISSTGGGPYTLPIAQPSTLGGIKPDNTTITVNASTGVASATGGGTNNWTSNSGVPTANCTVGTGTYLYFDTAFTNPGMPIYYCSATNVWTQGVNLGGSGCLAFTAGSLDIVSACIPQKNVANTFGASQSEGLGAKWGSTHGTVSQTSGWAALSGGTSGAIATSSIAALGTPGAAGDWVEIQNLNCMGYPTYSVVVGVSITIADPISESCSVHWEIHHDN